MRRLGTGAGRHGASCRWRSGGCRYRRPCRGAAAALWLTDRTCSGSGRRWRLLVCAPARFPGASQSGTRSMSRRGGACRPRFSAGGATAFPWLAPHASPPPCRSGRACRDASGTRACAATRWRVRAHPVPPAVLVHDLERLPLQLAARRLACRVHGPSSPVRAPQPIVRPLLLLFGVDRATLGAPQQAGEACLPLLDAVVSRVLVGHRRLALLPEETDVQHGRAPAARACHARRISPAGRPDASPGPGDPGGGLYRRPLKTSSRMVCSGSSLAPKSEVFSER